MAKKKKRMPAGDLSREAVQEIFESHEEAAEVLELLPIYLKERFGRSKGKRFGGFGFFGIERIRVEFTKSVKYIEVENSYATNTAIIYAPVIRGESAADREERVMALTNYYLPCTNDSQERATVQFYELVKRAGRSRLLRELKQKYKRRKSK